MSHPAQAPTPSARRSRQAWAVWLVAIAVLAVFGRTITHEFVEWDDLHTIGENPRFRPPTLASIASFWRVIEPADSGRPMAVHHEFGLWVPLTYTVWGALAAVAQVRNPIGNTIEINPYIFHAANVALHAATSVIVLLLLRRTIASTSAAVIGALLYALHPVQVETVAWASGTKDLLAGFLGMTALLAYVAQGDDRRSFARRRLLWWAATLLFAGALLSKPSAVTVPLIAAVIDLLILGRRPGQAALALLPWLVIAIPIAIIAREAQPGVTLDPIPPWAPPLIAGDSVAFYLGKLFVPVGLAFDYGRPPAWIVQRGWVYVTWILPAVALAATVAAAIRGHRLPLAALLVFVLAPLPVLGLTPFLFQYYSTTADHYLYVAMLGPAMLATWLAATYPSRMLRVCATVVLCVLAGLSFRQAGFWRDAETLFARNVAVSPRGWAGLNNLGLIRARQEQYTEAASLLRRAVAARPDSINATQNLREVLTMLNLPDECMGLLRREIRLKHDLPYHAAGAYWTDHNHMGKLLLLRGEYQKAANHFTLLSRLQPDDPQAPKLLMLANQMLARQPSAPATAPAATRTGSPLQDQFHRGVARGRDREQPSER